MQQLWSLLLLSGNRGDTCLAPVADHSAETLLTIIKAYIVPDTAIVSECWVYNVCLCSERLTHQAVNRSVGFVVHRCSHTYTIKATWKNIKIHLRPY